jgi:hypothetical protein
MKRRRTTDHRAKGKRQQKRFSGIWHLVFLPQSSAPAN